MPAVRHAVIIARHPHVGPAGTGRIVTFRHGNCEIESSLAENSRTTVSFSGCRHRRSKDSDNSLRAIRLRERPAGELRGIVNHRASRRSKNQEWIHRVDGRQGGDVVASRGTIVQSGLAIDYYTTQPSAGQWIALGVVPLSPGIDGDEATHRVIVGTGPSEETAIDSLRERATPILGVTKTISVSTTYIPTSEPSDWFG